MPKKSDDLRRLDQSQAARRSNLAEWYSNQFTELDLPSGLHVVVRDVEMEDLLAMGSIPNTMMTLIPELQGLDDQKAAEKMMGEQPESFADFLNAIVKAALVEPAIGDVTDVEKNVIALKDIRGKDKMFLFTWINREVQAVRSFREGENEPAPAA